MNLYHPTTQVQELPSPLVIPLSDVACRDVAAPHVDPCSSKTVHPRITLLIFAPPFTRTLQRVPYTS